MQEYLTSYDVANAVRMLRTQFKGTIIIIEGITDEIVYEKLFTNCKFIIAANREKVEGTIDILENSKFKLFLGIVDADFDRLEGIDKTRDNLLITDYHDIECMILKSPALEKVLKELGVGTNEKNIELFIEKLIQVILPLEYLRWLSSKHKENYGLKFKNLDFYEFLILETFQIDIDKLIEWLINNTRNCTYDSDTIKQTLTKLIESSSVNKWELCNGHDLVQIIFIKIQQIENPSGKNIKLKKFQRLLRDAYEIKYFIKTNLYTKIKEWGKRNNFQLIG